MTQMKKSPFLSKSELARELGVSTRTINRMVEAGQLPKPRRESYKGVYWRRLDIDGHLYKLAHPDPTPSGELQFILRKSDLAALFGVSTRTINRWVESGKLPEPQREGYRTIYWYRPDVEHLLHELAPSDFSGPNA
jgi:predicted DNA-binding transcriptional regulator AlpA